MQITENAMNILADLNSVKIISSATKEGYPHIAIADSMMAMSEDRLFVMEKKTDLTFENMLKNKEIAVLVEKEGEAYLFLATVLERYTEGAFYEIMTKGVRNNGESVEAVWTFIVKDILDKGCRRSA